MKSSDCCSSDSLESPQWPMVSEVHTARRLCLNAVFNVKVQLPGPSSNDAL